MTPDELQRVLRTENDHQPNLDAIENWKGPGRFVFAILFIIVLAVVFYGTR